MARRDSIGVDPDRRLVDRLCRLLGVIGAIFVFGVGTASAHNLPSDATRFAAPIPLYYLYAGGGLVAFVTAVASALLVRTPERHERSYSLLSARHSRLVSTAVRLLAVVIFAVVVVRGVIGLQNRTSNVATLLTWAVVFDGFALGAALFGTPWRVVAPWHALYDLLTVLEGRELRVADVDVSRLSQMPALLGFVVVIGITENLTVVPESPADTSVLLVGYTLVVLAGMVLVGREWVDQTDFIGVFLRLFARVAPVRFTLGGAGGVDDADGGLRVTLRPPWDGPSRPVATTGAAAFVVAAVFTISFDGFTQTPEFRNLLFWTHDALSVPFGVLGISLYVVGLVGFLVSYALTIALVARLGDDDYPSAAKGFAPTVLPIAVGYEFAHYSTYVVGSAARLVEVALGGIGLHVALSPLAWLSVPAYWQFEVVAIVFGHAIAVIAAHYAALRRYPDRRTAWRAHLPLVVLMVGYTALSLWIISRPVVM